MLEIRFHSRGGQGGVSASEMLAAMYFESGKFTQAFPAFGVERRGAPVLAYTRIDERPIEIHYGIYAPDRLIVLDSTILETMDVTQGLKKGGMILINTDKCVSDFKNLDSYKVYTIDANSIAISHRLGTASSPIVNTSILGAYAAISGDLPVELIQNVIVQSSPIKKEENASAVVEAFEEMKSYGS